MSPSNNFLINSLALSFVLSSQALNIIEARDIIPDIFKVMSFSANIVQYLLSKGNIPCAYVSLTIKTQSISLVYVLFVDVSANGFVTIH